MYTAGQIMEPEGSTDTRQSFDYEDSVSAKNYQGEDDLVNPHEV